MPTKDLQKKAKELNEPLPGSMLPTKDLQEKAKEFNESLPGSMLPSKDRHEKANDLESSNRDGVDSLPAKQMRKLLRTLRKHFLRVDARNYELGSGIQLASKHIRHYCSECGTPSDGKRLGINPLTLLYRLINQCLRHKASHRYTKEFARLREICDWSRHLCDADIAEIFDHHVKAFLQADTWTMPWAPGERPYAISPPHKSWFHVHSGVATATEAIATNATANNTQATAIDTPGIATAANDTHAIASDNTQATAIDASGIATAANDTHATASENTQATAIDAPGIATAANDTHATASENAKHKNAGKTVRVNQATPK